MNTHAKLPMKAPTQYIRMLQLLVQLIVFLGGMSLEQNQIPTLQQVLLKTWSIKSGSKWTLENPALGQCAVTALVVHDLLGGDILKTLLPSGFHFYNRISGKRYDFTESQFSEPLVYEDQVSSRDEAFSDTNEEQYNYLMGAMLNNLSVD